jgi:UDP-2,3-diacylglucosamine pyrophosphatase LpxH
MHYKSLFVSDLHLGHPSSKADQLLEILDQHQFDNIYLIGDIIDLWYLKRHSLKFYKTHTLLIEKIIHLSNAGVAVTYVIGNHDESLKSFLKDGQFNFGQIKLLRETEHLSLGRRFLITHGDKYDSLTYSKSGRFVMLFGDFLYDLVSFIDRIQLSFRKLFKMKYWSFAGFCKKVVKGAITFIQNYEKIITNDAKELGYDGVICGHIHHPKKEIINGILYLNDGDFMESCSALIETTDGDFDFIFNEPQYITKK